MSVNGGTVNDCAPSILKQTIDHHIEDAERWGENLPGNTDPIQMTGWRPTSYVLAQEVRRLRSVLATIADPSTASMTHAGTVDTLRSHARAALRG